MRSDWRVKFVRPKTRNRRRGKVGESHTAESLDDTGKARKKRLSGPFVEFSGEGQSSIGDGWHTERISTQLRRVVPRMVPSVSMVPSTQAGIHAVGARCCLPRTAKPYGPPAVVVGPHTPLDTVRRMQGASGSDHRALHDRRSVTRMGTEQRSQS